MISLIKVKKIVLPLILIFVSLIVFANSVTSQEKECQVVGTGRYQTGTENWIEIDICAQDYKACNDEYAVENDKCFKIEDACNKNCNHGLATLSFMPCKECTEKAKPCYDAALEANKQCIFDHNQIGKTGSIIESVPMEDGLVQALIDRPPSKADLKINENAKKLNDQLKMLFGDTQIDGIPTRLKVPEITGDTPYFFDNPLSTKDNRYFSFTANVKNHIIEYQGGNKITLEFPDGTSFVPESGDFIRVPVGTKVRTEMGLYQGDSQYDSIGKFGMSSLGITNVAGGSAITLGGGSLVELVPVENGGTSNVKLNNGDIRVGTGGFGATDKPDLPTEIQFEGRQDVEISWDGTDFGVSYDEKSGRIIAEIYDGTIKVIAGEKKYELTSRYGDEIKRVEIEENGMVVGKTALSGQEWQKKQINEPASDSAVIEKKRARWEVALMTLTGLMVVGGMSGGLWWYRRKYQIWPLEARWRPILKKFLDH